MSEDASKEVDSQSQSTWTPNKVNIEQILLFKFDSLSGTAATTGVELAPFIASVEIDQSMFSPFVDMVIEMGSPMGVVEGFGELGLQGEEFVLVEFHTEGRRTFKMVFFVTSLNVQNDVLDQVQGATLHCVSIEKLYNDVSTVNSSFNGLPSRTAMSIFANKIQNNPVAKKLKTVLGASGSDIDIKKLEVLKDSKQEEDFIIPGLTPFEAIDFCARRSYSSDYVSSYFTFYQTSKGYRFDSVEARIEKSKAVIDGLLTESKTQKIDPTGLFFTNNHNASAYMDKFSKALNRNIKSISTVSRPDTLTRINQGAFFNKIRAIDLYGKNYTDTEFKIKDKYKSFKRLGEKFSLSDGFVDTVCSNEEYDFQYFKDATRRNQDFEKIIGHRLAYMDLLTTYGLNIVVPGDSELVPGDVIWVDLGEAHIGAGGLEGKSLVESMYSQLWLVLNHKIIFDQGEISSVLTITKDSLADVNKGID